MLPDKIKSFDLPNFRDGFHKGFVNFSQLTHLFVKVFMKRRPANSKIIWPGQVDLIVFPRLCLKNIEKKSIRRYYLTWIAISATFLDCWIARAYCLDPRSRDFLAWMYRKWVISIKLCWTMSARFMTRDDVKLMRWTIFLDASLVSMTINSSRLWGGVWFSGSSAERKIHSSLAFWKNRLGSRASWNTEWDTKTWELKGKREPNQFDKSW